MADKYICKDCQYKWVSRKSYDNPSKCPSCNSKNIISNEKYENYKKINKIINKRKGKNE